MHAYAGNSVARHLQDAPCPHPVLSGTGNAAEPHPPQNSTATATSQETSGPTSTRPGAAPARASFALNLTSQITSRTRTKTLPDEEFPKKRSDGSAHTCTSTCFPEPQYYRRFPDFESGTPRISQKPTRFPRREKANCGQFATFFLRKSSQTHCPLLEFPDFSSADNSSFTEIRRFVGYVAEGGFPLSSHAMPAKHVDVLDQIA